MFTNVISCSSIEGPDIFQESVANENGYFPFVVSIITAAIPFRNTTFKVSIYASEEVEFYKIFKCLKNEGGTNSTPLCHHNNCWGVFGVLKNTPRRNNTHDIENQQNSLGFTAGVQKNRI